MNREVFFRVFRRRSSAYKAVFNGESASWVLADLRKFCHANATTAVRTPNGIDAIGSAQLEGRRQVYMRIVQMCSLDEATVQEMIERIDDE